MTDKITQDDLDDINKRPQFSRESILRQILYDVQISDDEIDKAVEDIINLFNDKKNKK